MSLPDYLLNDSEEFCDECSAIITKGRRLCGECRQDWEDKYGDEAYQDKVEGK